MSDYAPHSSTGASSLLSLPPEIRREIFIILFRSTTIYMCRDGPHENEWEHRLSILWACRQIHFEAAPLALPNVTVYCSGNHAMMNTLTLIGPERIPKLRHLIISHIPIGFRLEPSAEWLEAASAVGEGSGTSGDLDEDDGMRFFHAGSLLGLFPGLQLDLLEVFLGVGGGPYTGSQTTDCFGSLLEADGYRRLWMEATSGDGDAWIYESSAGDVWKEAIERKFRPNTGTGWKIRIRLRPWEWRGRENLDLWVKAGDAGVTLVKSLDNGFDDADKRSASEGHVDEEDVDIIVDRGDGVDFSVKQGDGAVLRCIEWEDSVGQAGGETPESLGRTSDALRKLFRENTWERIKAMEGYDDGTCDSWNQGDRAYALLD